MLCGARVDVTDFSYMTLMDKSAVKHNMLKLHHATGSLTRFSTRQVPDVGDFPEPETLGVVSNCEYYALHTPYFNKSQKGNMTRVLVG